MKKDFCEVILITGFLGAGKTTLLRNILQWPGDLSKTAVLVNEFGQIGIDGELLQGFRTPVYELTNGCICCTLQGDFHSTVVEILDGFRPKRLLIEATGVADPYDVLSFLKASRIENRISAPKVVTVLAGDLWEGREYFGPLFYNQIKAAELLLFNKVAPRMLAAEEYMIQKRVDVLTAELSQVGVTHTAVGEALMDHWGLPQLLIECARNHHEVVHDGPNREATHLVYLANCLSTYVPPLDEQETQNILDDIENWDLGYATLEQVAFACQHADDMVFEVMESLGMIALEISSD